MRWQQLLKFTYFMKAELKGSKPDHVKSMSTLMTQHCGVMPRVLDEVSKQAGVVQPVAPLALQCDSDGEEESSSSDEEELTIGDMIWHNLALNAPQAEHTIEDPMSDEPGVSDDGA